MTKEKRMEWDEWKETYDPVMVQAYLSQDDGVLLELDTIPEVVAYIQEHLPILDTDDFAKYVWTETAGDGWTYVSTGFHWVDRSHYYICLNPWTKENEACMYDEIEGSWCDECDGYTVECEHDDEDWQDKQDMLAEEKANE